MTSPVCEFYREDLDIECGRTATGNVWYATKLGGWDPISHCVDHREDLVRDLTASGIFDVSEVDPG